MPEIIYGETHCPHCEKPYAGAAEAEHVEAQLDAGAREDDYGRWCWTKWDGMLCPPAHKPAERLIAVLQERDALRAELARVHAGQLSLLGLGG